MQIYTVEKHIEKWHISQKVYKSRDAFKGQEFGHQNRHQTNQYIHLTVVLQRSKLICRTLSQYQPNVITETETNHKFTGSLLWLTD